MEPSLLDTDVVSEIWRGRNSQVVQRARAYRAKFGQYTTSAITVVEITKGLVRAQQVSQLATISERFATEEILPLDGVAAVIAGRIYGELERTGQTIGRSDPMIAAIALRHGLTLVTGNIAHFQRIANLGLPLVLANWRS
jgi:tRNA(fMet)-specific endonuclease VapC